MKALVTILSSLLIAVTAFSSPGNEGTPITAAQKLKIVQGLANTMMAQDVRKVVTLDQATDKAHELCGPGPSYKIEIQIKKYNKVPDQQGNPVFVEYWETVKTYAISSDEVTNGTYGPLPMDLDQCL